MWVRADHAADNAQQFANAVRVTVSSMWRPMHSAACRFSGLLTAAPEQPNSASGRRVSVDLQPGWTCGVTDRPVAI